MSVDSKMTAIADKIRGLRGLTGTMGLDAMATNLQAEQTSITNALAALADKGVSVPDGSTSDALAGLIEALETGGGALQVLASGSFTPSETIDIKTNEAQAYTIQHGSGTVPKAAIVYTGSYGTSVLTIWACVITGEKMLYNGNGYEYYPAKGFAVYSYYSNAANYGEHNAKPRTGLWNESTFSVNLYSTMAQLKSGLTHNWVVFG